MKINNSNFIFLQLLKNMWHNVRIFVVKLKIFKNKLKSIYKKNEIQHDFNDIKKKFDMWLFTINQKYKTKDFIEENFIPTSEDTSKYYAIQQVEKEIFEFVKVILSKGLTNSILEIGLGYYGGTHTLWRLIFKKVITVEISIKGIKRFIENEPLSFRDIFIIGNSQSPKIFKKVKKISKNIDVLFLDGDHKYESVKTDYLLYRRLVKKGGIIAFHDSACTLEHLGFGINRFLKDLETGKIDGQKHILSHIILSKMVGISYEIKE